MRRERTPVRGTAPTSEASRPLNPSGGDTAPVAAGARFELGARARTHRPVSPRAPSRGAWPTGIRRGAPCKERAPSASDFRRATRLSKTSTRASRGLSDAVRHPTSVALHGASPASIRLSPCATPAFSSGAGRAGEPLTLPVTSHRVRLAAKTDARPELESAPSTRERRGTFRVRSAFRRRRNLGPGPHREVTSPERLFTHRRRLLPRAEARLPAAAATASEPTEPGRRPPTSASRRETRAHPERRTTPPTASLRARWLATGAAGGERNENAPSPVMLARPSARMAARRPRRTRARTPRVAMNDAAGAWRIAARRRSRRGRLRIATRMVEPLVGPGCLPVTESGESSNLPPLLRRRRRGRTHFSPSRGGTSTGTVRANGGSRSPFGVAQR